MAVVKLYRESTKQGVQIACPLRMGVAYEKYYTERASEKR